MFASLQMNIYTFIIPARHFFIKALNAVFPLKNRMTARRCSRGSSGFRFILC